MKGTRSSGGEPLICGNSNRLRGNFRQPCPPLNPEQERSRMYSRAVIVPETFLSLLGVSKEDLPTLLSLFGKIINNQKEIIILRKARDTPLPLLMFGKLRVEEVQNV